MAFLLTNSSRVLFGKPFLKFSFLQGQQLQIKGLKTTAVILNLNKQNPDATKHNESSNTRKKNKETFKITLMQNHNMTVTALEDAKNLAKRRSMHLVKVVDMDSKTQRPVYKLLTAAEMLQSELTDETKSDKRSDKAAAASKKSEKFLSISARIAEHDLSSRLKNISKWLNKQHDVRILIQASSEKDLVNCEKIFKAFEEIIKTPQVIGRIVQKRTTGNAIKFSILPVTPATSDKTTSSQ